MSSKYSQFIKLCDADNIEDIKSFYNSNRTQINLNKYNCYIFRYICDYNKLDILKWIYNMSEWEVQIEIGSEKTEKGLYFPRSE